MFNAYSLCTRNTECLHVHTCKTSCPYVHAESFPCPLQSPSCPVCPSFRPLVEYLNGTSGYVQRQYQIYTNADIVPIGPFVTSADGRTIIAVRIPSLSFRPPTSVPCPIHLNRVHILETRPWPLWRYARPRLPSMNMFSSVHPSLPKHQEDCSGTIPTGLQSDQV